MFEFMLSSACLDKQVDIKTDFFLSTFLHRSTFGKF